MPYFASAIGKVFVGLSYHAPRTFAINDVAGGKRIKSEQRREEVSVRFDATMSRVENANEPDNPGDYMDEPLRLDLTQPRTADAETGPSGTDEYSDEIDDDNIDTLRVLPLTANTGDVEQEAGAAELPGRHHSYLQMDEVVTASSKQKQGKRREKPRSVLQLFERLQKQKPNIGGQFGHQPQSHVDNERGCVFAHAVQKTHGHVPPFVKCKNDEDCLVYHTAYQEEPRTCTYPTNLERIV
ncbi:unnamed protein product [Amoebophrya sp. A120]|nr:unnamed protein product [Amoebophrya sp. A120]|eukprot:GSA120T00020344001.1